MLTKFFRLVFVASVSFAATAWAGSLQGVVSDRSGQPVKGAEIRVESRNGRTLVATTKTDAMGRYSAADLPAGTYRVTLLANGGIRASINNTPATANTPTELNLQLETGGRVKQAKHMVWVRSDSGSRAGGRWVEVDEARAAIAGSSSSDTATGSGLQRQIPSSNANGMEDDWARRWIRSTH